MDGRSLDDKDPVFYITATSKGTYSRLAAASSKAALMMSIIYGERTITCIILVDSLA
jgi:hypothetical protein